MFPPDPLRSSTILCFRRNSPFVFFTMNMSRYGLVRRAFGVVLGAGLRLYDLDHTVDGQLGVGVLMALDLLLNRDVSVTIMPVVGWLLASLRLHHAADNHYKRKPRKQHNPNLPDEAPSSTDFVGPETTRHARFDEIHSASASGISPSSEESSTSRILPLTKENVLKASLTSSGATYDGSSTVRASSITEFETAPPAPSNSSSSTTGSPGGTSHALYFHTSGSRIDFPETDFQSLEDDVDLDELEENNRVGPSTIPFHNALWDVMDDTQMSLEEHGRDEGDKGTEVGVGPSAVETEVEKDGTMYAVSETASLSSTMRSSELEGPARDLCRKAENFRDAGIQARKIMEGFETRRREEMRQGRSNEAFRLKFAIQELRKEAEQADRKAAKLYYRARNRLKHPRRNSLIDVHFLKKGEALNMVEKELREVQLQGGRHLRVIVGQGKHSRGQEPVLKRHIQSKMRSQGIRTNQDARNPGVLNISLV